MWGAATFRSAVLGKAQRATSAIGQGNQGQPCQLGARLAVIIHDITHALLQQQGSNLWVRTCLKGTMFVMTFVFEFVTLHDFQLKKTTLSPSTVCA